MASVIYPYPNNALDNDPTQTEKDVIRSVKASFPDGYIIAKGNRIEGITALE